jgi:hypothetical protein
VGIISGLLIGKPAQIDAAMRATDVEANDE